jgi:GntR family transcriptional repressor for pyruvate dehydrogenase complex
LLSTERYQRIIDRFLQSLQDGTLKPNDKIHSENQLARILHIPRSQVHEVYTALSILGVLYGEQGKGTFLGAGDLGQNTRILYLMTLAAGGNFQDVLAVRRILETGGARAAAKNRTEEQLNVLRRCARTIEDSRDPRELTDADTALHAQLLKASGNALLHCLFQIVVGYMTRISLQHWTDVLNERDGARREEYVRQHWDLVRAVEDGSGERLQRLLEFHFDTLERNYGLAQPESRQIP